MSTSFKMASKSPGIRTHALLVVLVFVSASPIFGAPEKVVGALMVMLALVVSGRFQVAFQLSALISFGLLTFALLPYVMFLDLVRSNEFYVKGLGFWVAMVAGFVISSQVHKEDLFAAIRSCVMWTLIPGLLLWLLAVLVPSLIDFGPLIEYGGLELRTFGVTNFQYADDILVLDRFTGFASEPGLTQLFLNLALWSYLSQHAGRVRWQSMLIMVALVFTRSTTGIALMLLVLASTMPWRKLLVGIGALLLLLPGYLYRFFSYQIEEKLIGSSSFAIRYDRYDFLTNRDLFDVLAGYGNHYYMNEIVPENLAGWDSFLQLAQVYGLWFPLFLFVALCLVNRKHWVAAIIIVATFFAQSIWMMPIIVCFYFAHSVNLGNANFPGAVR